MFYSHWPPKPVNCPLRGFMGHKNPSKRHLCRSSSSNSWGHRNILHMLPVDGALAPLRPTWSCVFLTGEKRFHRYPDKAYSSTRSWRWQQTRSERWVMLGWLKPQPPPPGSPSDRVSGAAALANKICVTAPAVGWGLISQHPSARATICCWLIKGKGWGSRSHASAGRKERPKMKRILPLAQCQAWS